MLPRINLLALCILALSLFSIAEAQTLRNAAAARGLRVGAAVNMSPFRNEPIYTQTLGREFNVLVAENAMKFDAMHPSQNTYNFTDADALVTFAEANNMAVRGHTLVWHSQIPGWLTGGNFTRDQVILPGDGAALLVQRDGRWHPACLVARYGADFQVRYLDQRPNEEMVTADRVRHLFAAAPGEAKAKLPR